MKNRAVITALSLVILSACAAPPADTSDDYFQNINNESPALRAERERLARAEARGSQIEVDIIDTTTPASAIDGQPARPNQAGAPNTADLIRQDQAAQATPTPEDRSSISNSQDFEAVTGRVTADSDAAKLEELKRTYRVFEPTSVPTRGDSVDLEAYARDNRDRALGRKRFSRRKSDYKEAGNSYCLEYSDQNLAQINFLNQGGPRKDPLLLDRDGDGFACGWRPDRYLRALDRSNRRVVSSGPPIN